MFWLYLLATVTILTIALRRVVLRQKPMDDELFSRAVAFEHIQSGIVWVKSDGSVGNMNTALADMLGIELGSARGMSWFDLFAKRDRAALETAYSSMLLAGKASVQVNGRNALFARDHEDADENVGGKIMPDLDLLIIGLHDQRMRFIGHHCLVADRRRERVLETQLRELRRQTSLSAMALANRIGRDDVASDAGTATLGRRTR
jgi:PAS domain S-box-containing protein